MKTVLVLDVSKWRCGGSKLLNKSKNLNKNLVGEGSTALHNACGFECCLGQFSLQLANLRIQDIMHKTVPADLKIIIPSLTKMSVSNKIIDTNLATHAMSINDNTRINTKTRIEKLKELFGEYNYEIEIINYEEV